MTNAEIYSQAVRILDNFLEESLHIYDDVPQQNHWKGTAIRKLLKQANNILFCLLSNTEDSKYIKDTYVVDIILIGTLGRVLRDLYVLIAYLNTTRYTDTEMKLCWDYQVANRKLIVVQFADQNGYSKEIGEIKRQEMDFSDKIKQLSFTNKSKVLKGTDEKMTDLEELAYLKGFDKDKFNNHYIFFSQFVHTAAFANDMVHEEGIDLNLIAHMYDLIPAYYVGILFESLNILQPSHHLLHELKIQYEQIIRLRWNK